MERTLYDRIYRMLLKHTPNDTQSVIWVTHAWHDTPLLSRLQYGTAPANFASRLLEEALNFGTLTIGGQERHALIILLETLREQVGGEDQRTINELILTIETERAKTFSENQPQLPAPKKSLTPSIRISVGQLLPAPFTWINIPAGRIILDSGDYLHNASTFEIAPFKIAKYPITNPQFRIFEQHPDGFTNPDWWNYSREAQIWRSENPQPQATAFSGSKLPRTNVSWYEAVAFTRWLTAISGEDVRVPTEQQWQWAAQGDDGRLYPWGNRWDDIYCNNRYASLLSLLRQKPKGHGQQTTPIDGYSAGASRFGVMDMSGNVNEWCLSIIQRPYPIDQNKNLNAKRRAMRGGSWHDTVESSFATSFCHTAMPYVRYDTIGFRIISVSPVY